MIYLGIDPGLDGAICAYNGENHHAVLHDIPTVTVHKPHRTKRGAHRAARLYNVPALAEILRQYRPCFVCIEQVSAMPPQRRGQPPCPSCGQARVRTGATSAMQIGRGLGMYEGLCAALELPYGFVTPVAWKRAFGLIGKDKDEARLLVLRQYPALAGQLAHKANIGRADALLIARFGAQKQLFS